MPLGDVWDVNKDRRFVVGSLATAILAAPDGAWALLVPNGTAWENMAGTP